MHRYVIPPWEWRGMMCNGPGTMCDVCGAPRARCWMRRTRAHGRRCAVLPVARNYLTRCLRVPAPDTWRVHCWMGGLNDCAVGYCLLLSPLCPRCVPRQIAKLSTNRRGIECGGRQYVLAEYVRYAKELLKDGAAEGDWICVTCRNTIRLRAATFGAAADDDAPVRVLPCNSALAVLNGAVHRIGVGSRTTS